MQDKKRVIKNHPVLGIEVSSDGRVKLPRHGWTFGCKTGNYYHCWVKGQTYWVHRLIAETFIQNPENKPQVDHINRDPSDNRVENLRWVTQFENMRNTRDCDRVEKDGHLHSWEGRWQKDMHLIKFSEGKQHRVTEKEYAILRAFKPCHRVWRGRRG